MRRYARLAALAMTASATLVTIGLLHQTGASAAIGDFDYNRPETVASGLEVPWGLTFLPDGSALVAERMSARVLQLRPGSAPQTVATVPGVVPGGEGGLLGLAVSPTYSQDQWVYAYF